MPSQTDPLKETIRWWTLFLGVLQITTGCVVGLIPPTAVDWFRGIVMAHIEFTANGVLMVAFGFLVRELRLGRTAFWAWFVLLQIGTWTNGASGVIAAFQGAAPTKMMPTLTEKFPPPNGSESALVSNTLIVCAVTILAALLITLYGLIRAKGSAARPTS